MSCSQEGVTKCCHFVSRVEHGAFTHSVFVVVIVPEVLAHLVVVSLG